MILRRLRLAAVVAVIATVSTITLTGCEIAATGTGTVTVTSDTPANAYNGVSGSVARVCPVSSATCTESDPYLYTYYPAEDTSEWVVSPGFQVIDRSGQIVGLPAGQYTLQPTEYRPGAVFLNAVTIDVYGSTDLTIWHQSYGRADSDSSCREGWQPGWAQWPNEGTGGFVCNREVYAYYPDVPVSIPGTAAGGTPWLQSVARVSIDAPCPDSYTPGWAQWPNDGRGGAVCNRTIT